MIRGQEKKDNEVKKNSIKRSTTSQIDAEETKAQGNHQQKLNRRHHAHYHQLNEPKRIKKSRSMHHIICPHSYVGYNFEHERYDLNLNSSKFGCYKNAAVAVDSAMASQVGKSILEKSGNVVDAAIAALLCNGLLNAQSMGIGGGFFMLHYSKKNEKVTVIDARETAPMRSSNEMFTHKTIAHGGLSIAVPGEIKGYWEAHQQFGSMKWSELFKPAIEMCHHGYEMPHSQYRFLKLNEVYTRLNADWRETFVNKLHNQIFVTNNRMTRCKLGDTLEAIARDGESAFYNGVLTDTIINEIQSNGGIITKEDLNNYKVLVKDPVEIRLKNGITVNGVPPPSCGVLLNFILSLLDSYEDIEDSNAFKCPNKTSQFYHRFIEASKFAFGFRQFIGDPNFVDTTWIESFLKDPEIIEEYHDKIDLKSVHATSFYGGSEFVADSGTAHLSIIGPNGDAVAVTSSINHAFGSKVIGANTNIHYNNQMDDFSVANVSNNAFGVRSCKNNYIEPGKRPVSSMVPIIAVDEDKNVKMTCGGSGGTRILTSCALVAAKNLIHSECVLDSVDSLRMHNQLYPNEVLFEEGVCEQVENTLSCMGHKMINFGQGGSAVQAIERRDGILYAVSDRRKGGVPSGY